MALRDKMRANAQPHLEPGETIQVVFGSQTHSQWLIAFTGLITGLLFNRYVLVVVTDRRIFLGKSGALTMSKCSEVLASLPRQTQIGPASGLWHKTESLGRKLYIHRRFHSDVADADRLISAGAPAAPQNWANPQQPTPHHPHQVQPPPQAWAPTQPAAPSTPAPPHQAAPPPPPAQPAQPAPTWAPPQQPAAPPQPGQLGQSWTPPPQPPAPPQAVQPGQPGQGWAPPPQQAAPPQPSQPGQPGQSWAPPPQPHPGQPQPGQDWAPPPR